MYRKYFKRIFDFAISILVLPFWLILLIIIGTIIYFQDKGSIFFNAQRLGKNGRVFIMYKFRSMKMDAPDIRNEDGSTFNSNNDPRLTRIGRFIRKTSLDETPQIINIIKGDMSIIGPRPDLPEHLALYVDKEMRKLEVRPGITGYNQAYFRNTIPWKERIKNDIFYIDHLTFIMDVKVFFKTIVTVLKREAVYINLEAESTNSENIHEH